MQGKHVGASLFLPLDSSHATLLLQQLSCKGSCFKGLHSEFSVMNMIITKVVAWKPLGGYGHLFAHFKLLPCVASCPMPNVVQFALTILLFSSSTNGFIIPYNYGVFWSCSVMAYWVTNAFMLWNTFWTGCIYIYIYRTSFRHLAPGTSSYHLPPGKGCLKVRCPCLSSRYWSYSLHAQINSAVSYVLFLLYRLRGVRTLATQTHQLLEVLHPGLLPQLQLHVVTKLR